MFILFSFKEEKWKKEIMENITPYYLLCLPILESHNFLFIITNDKVF